MALLTGVSYKPKFDLFSATKYTWCQREPVPIWGLFAVYVVAPIADPEALIEDGSLVAHVRHPSALSVAQVEYRAFELQIGVETDGLVSAVEGERRVRKFIPTFRLQKITNIAEKGSFCLDLTWIYQKQGGTEMLDYLKQGFPIPSSVFLPLCLHFNTFFVTCYFQPF